MPFSAIENLEAVNLSLPDNTKMKLKGRIDRIDYCENEEEVFVKVVDYKSETRNLTWRLFITACSCTGSWSI